jgi:WD40 repeat protein
MPSMPARLLPALALLILPQAGTAEPRTDSFGDPLPAGVLARSGTLRLRHGAPVTALVFCPDGKGLLSASQDGTVRLWDTVTGKELRRFEGHRGAVFCVAVSADGKTLATGGEDKTARLWDVATGKRVRLPVQYQETVDCVAFSPDGKRLAAGGRWLRPQVRDVATGKVLGEIRGEAAVVFDFSDPQRAGEQMARRTGALGIAFSGDGQSVAVGNAGRPLVLYDAVTGAERRHFEGHTRAVTTVLFAPDGKTLVSCGTDQTVRFWDTDAGKELRKLTAAAENFFCCALSADGKTLATGSAGHVVVLWDTDTGKELRRLATAPYSPWAVAFSPDGKTLATAGDYQPIQLWEVATGKQQQLTPERPDPGYPVAFSPDGALAAVRAADNTLTLQETDRTGEIPGRLGKELRHFGPYPGVPRPARFSPDGKLLATANRDRSDIRLWDTNTGKELHHLQGHKSGVKDLVFTADGSALISVSFDRTVRFWSATTGKEERRLSEGLELYWPLALSPDGRFLAEARYEGHIHLWDLSSGQEVRRFAGRNNRVMSLAFSPDGKTLASGHETSPLCLWEVATGQERGRLAVGQCCPLGLAFAPDGRSLAGGMSDGILHFREMETHKFTVSQWPDRGPVLLWDLATGEPRRRLVGHQGSVHAVWFYPDGNRLVSTGGDTTTLTWDLTEPERRKPGAALSEEEAQGLWAKLAADDAVGAYRAVWKLAAAPRSVLPQLRKQLQPVPAVDADRLRRLLAELDHDSFEVRSQATRELERLGEAAEDAMRKALAGQPSAEARRRLEALVEKRDVARKSAPRSEELRTLRAMEVLEYSDDVEARRLLEALAQGAPQARLTQDARASLRRLAPRGPKP